MKSRSILQVVLSVFVAIGLVVSAQIANAAPDELTAAISAYQEGQQSADRGARLAAFKRSAILFSQAASSTPSSASLHANAGTAALQAAQPGNAALSLRRALLIDPEHARALRNLTLLREQLPDWVPTRTQTSATKTFFAWHEQVKVEQKHFIASLIALAFGVAGGLMLAVGTAYLRWISAILLVCWTTVVASAILGGSSGAQGAVVMTETMARASDSINAPTRFTQPLPAGTEVDILEQRQGWLRVALADRRTVWVRNSAVQRIAQPR